MNPGAGGRFKDSMRPARRRPRYVRFVAGGFDEDPYDLTGIFTISAELQREGRLSPYEKERLQELWDWFNEHLPLPPFEARLAGGQWTRDAVAWFRDGASRMIRPMWDIVAVLREHGESVRFFHSEEPGRIVYADDYQVVAESGRYGRRAARRPRGC